MREFDPSWQEDDLSWFRLGLHILSERRRLVLSVLLVLSLPLAAYALLVPEVPVFEARVLVQVESERTKMTDYAPTTGATDPEGSYYETQYRVLRSRTLARQTLAHLTPVRRTIGLEHDRAARRDVGCRRTEEVGAEPESSEQSRCTS